MSCIKNTSDKNFSVKRIKQNRLMLLSNCTICVRKKSTYIKNQEASGLLDKLGI